jgi:hypothetical protein
LGRWADTPHRSSGESPQPRGLRPQRLQVVLRGPSRAQPSGRPRRGATDPPPRPFPDVVAALACTLREMRQQR